MNTVGETGPVRRGTVTSKLEAMDVLNGRFVFVLGLLCDGGDNEFVVVSKETYDASCIAGLGQDTVIEFGTILRRVSP